MFALMATLPGSQQNSNDRQHAAYKPSPSQLLVGAAQV